jgi:AcrR family transcriptional regulator
MSPRPDVSSERKSQIMNAAETVFTRSGFEAARMEDIADETGLSKATIYLYFESKDDLIIAILDRIFQGEFKQFEDLIDDETSASDTIWKLVEIMTGDIVRALHLIPIVYNFLALAFRNQYVQHTLKEYLHRFMDILTPVIQRGIDSGEFRPLDAYEVAIAMEAITEGTLLLWVYDKNLIDPVVHIRSGMKILLEGLWVRN